MSIRKIQDSVYNLNNAVNNLKECISETDNSIIIDASIYRFQVTYRLVWKTLKRILEFEGFNEVETPREILKLCFSLEWISNEVVWLEILDINKQIIYAYTDKEVGIKIYQSIKKIMPELLKVTEKINSKHNMNTIVANSLVSLI